MAITETGVSLYGFTQLEHTRADLEDIKSHHCTAVLLSFTEFDLFFYRPMIPKIVDLAKSMGLTVYLNTWGIGKFFGGEGVSLFLQENPTDRQYTALTGEPIAAASPCSPAFQEYFWGHVQWLAKVCDADGFFWDEPHYAMPVHPVSYQSTADWTDRSAIAQKCFQDRYGYDMPKVLTDQVRKFRRDMANHLLTEAARIAKSVNPNLTVTHCSLPADNNFYVHHERGYEGWDGVAQTPEYDVFATSILIDPNTPLNTHERIARKTADCAKRHNKRSQRWIMSYMASPDPLSHLIDTVELYDRCGIDSVFSWTYRAGMNTLLSAPDPQAAWDTLGKAYASVLVSS